MDKVYDVGCRESEIDAKLRMKIEAEVKEMHRRALIRERAAKHAKLQAVKAARRAKK